MVRFSVWLVSDFAHAFCYYIRLRLSPSLSDQQSSTDLLRVEWYVAVDSHGAESVLECRATGKRRSDHDSLATETSPNRPLTPVRTHARNILQATASASEMTYVVSGGTLNSTHIHTPQQHICSRAVSSHDNVVAARVTANST